MRIILITGTSGSGKSVALNALEDAGYYCVDNLPPRFLPELAAYLDSQGQARLAVAIDARSSRSLDEVPAIINGLTQSFDVRVLFLNASTQSLIQRFSETRRRHPLSGSPTHDADVGLHTSLGEAIERERELVSGLAEFGHQIDTSNLRANVLRAWVKSFVEQETAGLTLMFESFGFKRGVPLDADFVFDVRTLPNPYYDRELRPLTGLDQPVIDFLLAQPMVHQMIDDIGTFIAKWLPQFREDNRSYLTVAIGCTGGQHRSVFIAQTLAARFGEKANVIVRHRDAPIALDGHVAPLQT
ncbi:glmZ(sRNA)-inactivating NTPase [Caballeronia sordidicola]|uniref:GlmZ(SRNA)-inactivating NTPase n=1 Tax=Caballeronia sordidicola TaxID=196367 RepID=A0A158F562_CABSO|nr:RNase adapter RapZ [Caballeronia sordidicola]SAL14874.1 glmZ(sRNA)-inactivating NTPase [Caballeronia sordidicola]